MKQLIIKKVALMLACGLLYLTLGMVASHAAVVTPVIDSIEGHATGAGTIYLNLTTGIDVVGTATKNVNLSVLVDSVSVATGIADGGGAYSLSFNTGASASVKTVVVTDTDNSLSSASQDILVDTTNPTISDVHWQNPADGSYVGPNLSKIWAVVSDAGGAGVDYTNSTISFSPVVTGITEQDGANIKFTPTGSNWGLFTNGTTYTITVTLKDKAGNEVSDNSHQFTVDRTMPTISEVHWQNPKDQSCVGPNLNKIWAVVSDGGAGIDYSSLNTKIEFTPAVSGTTSQDGSDIQFIPTGNNWALFLDNTTYTITVTVYDLAGNVRTNSSYQFEIDRKAPNPSAIHWSAPADNGDVGQGLNSIWAIVSDDTAGIDWTSSTITVTGIIGTKTNNGLDQINFIPASGWDPGDFANNTTYTVTTTVYDKAGNSKVDSDTFDFDYDSPTVSNTDIHWSDPSDGTYVGPNLNDIWVIVTDTGGSGINWSKSTLTVSGIAAYTNSNNGSNRIDFNPTNGWPTVADDKDFVHNTLYTVTATIYDNADNRTTVSRQFRFDFQAPTATLRWSNPDRSTAPDTVSYYMGQDLNRIWSVVSGTVTTTFGVDPIDTSNSKITISPVPGGGSSIYNGTNTIEWSVSDHLWFTSGTTYTVTITVYDKAGNTTSLIKKFMKDENAPTVTDYRISSPSISLAADNVIIRSSAFPIGPTNYFRAAITDNPADFESHTSLNGTGIGYHSDYPSQMSMSHESAGTLGGLSYTFGGSGSTYQGDLSTAGTYTPIEGVYSVSITARDWAYVNGSVNDHDGYRVSRFLVDNTAPQETMVWPTESADFCQTTDGTYLRSIDITQNPGNITVTAQDTPNDRGYSFGQRLNPTASTVTLYNPDNVTRSMSITSAWTQPGPVVTDLCNSFTARITQTDIKPTYSVPEYVGNVIEGRYTIRIHLEDKITATGGAPNVREVDYYFFNDVTPPRLVSWNPFSTIPLADSDTSNFSNVQATIMDPDLRDGFPGSGLDFDHCMVTSYVGLTDGEHPSGMWILGPTETSITSGGPFLGTQGERLESQVIEVFEKRTITTGRNIFIKVKDSTILSGGNIDISGLTSNKTYVIGWEIPATYVYDSVDTIGSVPDQAIIKNGFYFANTFVADMAGNTSQVESINFNYLSPGGTLTLTSSESVLRADGSSTATIQTSPVYLSGSNTTTVPDGTLITVSSSLGTIITPDEDSLLAGVQVVTAGGIATFVVQSISGQAGEVTLRAKSVSGFADSGNVSDILEIRLSLLANAVLTVEPSMEKLGASYEITAINNKITPLTINTDTIDITFPEGTILPSTMTSAAIQINDVNVSNMTLTDQVLTLVLPLTIEVDSPVKITIPESAGIINPRSGTYDLSVMTTQDQVAAVISYDILISIADDQVVAAPNPCKGDLMRFFFNMKGPGNVELMVLNLRGDRVSRVRNYYGAAKKGEVVDWATLGIAPGIYWTILSIQYDDGTKELYDKQKVVLIP